MITVTTGMIKAFDDCPKKYNIIYNEKMDIPSDNIASELGKKIHALINYKYKNFDIDKIITTLEEGENQDIFELWQNFIGFNIQDVDFSEYTFNVPLSEKIRLNGRIDAIRKIDDKYEIIDWKTGSSKNIDVVNDIQTMVYLYSIYRVFAYHGLLKSPVNLCMTYCFLKENKKISVSFDELKFKHFENILVQKITKMIDFNSNLDIDNDKCTKCAYNIICQ